MEWQDLEKIYLDRSTWAGVVPVQKVVFVNDLQHRLEQIFAAKAVDLVLEGEFDLANILLSREEQNAKH